MASPQKWYIVLPLLNRKVPRWSYNQTLLVHPLRICDWRRLEQAWAHRLFFFPLRRKVTCFIHSLPNFFINFLLPISLFRRLLLLRMSISLSRFITIPLLLMMMITRVAVLLILACSLSAFFFLTASSFALCRRRLCSSHFVLLFCACWCWMSSFSLVVSSFAFPCVLLCVSARMPPSRRHLPTKNGNVRWFRKRRRKKKRVNLLITILFHHLTNSRKEETTTDPNNQSWWLWGRELTTKLLVRTKQSISVNNWWLVRKCYQSLNSDKNSIYYLLLFQSSSLQTRCS